MPRILAAALAALLTLEFLLRLMLGLGSPLLFETDDRFGYFPKAGQHLHRFFVDIDTNQFGMRSSAVPASKSGGEYRILFVGDSVAFGTTYVDQKDIFAEKIAAVLLRNKAKRIRVLNASAPGWAPGNELAFLQARGLYQADMVVLVYNTKDLAQHFAPFQASPLYPTSNPPTAIAELWSRYIEPRIYRDKAAVDPGSVMDDGKPSLAAESGVLQTVDETWKLVTSQGTQFVILLLPAVTADVRRNQAGWDIAAANLHGWAVQRSVPILDLTKPIGLLDPKSVYFDGIHLRPLGDQVVADAFLRRFGASIMTGQSSN